jgi:hypothetical protein
MLSTILAAVTLDMKTTVTSKLNGAFWSTLVGPDFKIVNGAWDKQKQRQVSQAVQHSTAKAQHIHVNAG